MVRAHRGHTWSVATKDCPDSAVGHEHSSLRSSGDGHRTPMPFSHAFYRAADQVHRVEIAKIRFSVNES